MLGKVPVELELLGKSVSVHFTMDLLRVIDGKVGLANIFQFLSGKINYTGICDLVSVVFAEGGETIIPDDVYQYMFSQKPENSDSMLTVFTITRLISDACFPSDVEAAPKKTVKKRKKK